MNMIVELQLELIQVISVSTLATEFEIVGFQNETHGRFNTIIKNIPASIRKTQN